VSIVRDGILRHTETIKDDGGAIFSNHIAQELNISKEEAEILKLKHGIGMGSSSAPQAGFGASLELDDITSIPAGEPKDQGDDAKYMGAFKAEIERYLDKTMEILKNYEDKNNDKIKEVVITGGLACVNNISGFMKNYFKAGGMSITGVTIPDSPYLQALRCPDEEKQTYTVALGLALRGLAE
ncbi:MAG TPA: cell division protein FtsA, partial [Candidatus Wallbacteria bacterium]|nr:cell division protein FtsA [Candidatus Wallbacteria bacterium]